MHANRRWLLLRQGDFRKALLAFRRALRIWWVVGDQFERRVFAKQALSNARRGNTLAIALGGHVVLWDRTARKAIRDFPAVSPFPPFGFSRDGRLLAIGTSEGVVSLYDVETGNERTRLEVGGRLALGRIFT